MGEVDDVAARLERARGLTGVERIAVASDLAVARGHVAFPAVLDLERRVPPWLLRLSTDAGIEAFERKYGVEMPAALRTYYASVRLICLLQAAWGVDVFLEDTGRDDLPAIERWNGTPHLVIGYFPHCDTVCGAELTGSRQAMYWEGHSEGREPDTTLSEWVLGAAVRLLPE